MISSLRCLRNLSVSTITNLETTNDGNVCKYAHWCIKNMDWPVGLQYSTKFVKSWQVRVYFWNGLLSNCCINATIGKLSWRAAQTVSFVAPYPPETEALIICIQILTEWGQFRTRASNMFRHGHCLEIQPIAIVGLTMEPSPRTYCQLSALSWRCRIYYSLRKWYRTPVKDGISSRYCQRGSTMSGMSSHFRHVYK